MHSGKAAAMPGVHGILTGKDLPNTFGILPVSQDEHALCPDKVRMIGDPVVAIAAVDEHIGALKAHMANEKSLAEAANLITAQDSYNITSVEPIRPISSPTIFRIVSSYCAGVLSYCRPSIRLARWGSAGRTSGSS